MSSFDVQGWERVIQGEEKLTWDLWSAPIDTSSILTASGVELLKSAVQAFRKFFGEDFLENSRGKGHPLFSIYLMPGNDVRVVYIQLIDLFIHLQLLQTQKSFTELRKVLRNDKSWFGWGHALLQMEVAGLALRQGYEIEFEPSLESGRKMDLTVSMRNRTVNFELVQMGTDHSFRATALFRDRLNRQLMALSMTHSVSIRGDLFRIAEEPEFTQLVNEVDGRAKALKTLGESLAFNSDVARLMVTKSEHARLPELSGPPTQSDEWSCLEARINEKAKQTAGANNVWIRLDGLSGLWYFPGWAAHELREKLRLIAPLCQAVLRKYDHVAGIVLSNRWAWQVGQPEETVCLDGNFALRRHFSDGRERETIITRCDKGSRREVDAIMSWYAQEPSWLDWELSELEYPSIRELFM